MIKRGELYYADLSPVVGSEQGGVRPVLIIQNDIGNRYSPTIIAAAVTSQLGKDSGGNQVGYLLALLNCFKGRPHGDLGFTVPHVTADQAIHDLGTFHTYRSRSCI